MAGTITALEPTLQRLAALGDLKPDWDSYGGLPPTARAKAAAERLVRVVADEFGGRDEPSAMPYHVAPIADGGVGLEWRNHGSAVEVWVAPDGGYSFVTSATIGNPHELKEVPHASAQDVLMAVGRRGI